MCDRNAKAQAKADKFSAIVLSALTEAARRAAISYQQRGHLLATWSGGRVAWVAPGEALSRLGGGGDAEVGASAVEQGAAADGRLASLADRS